ncbi:MAG: RNA polymerase subunit sigma-70, partial [Bacilli bacterium]|nr:RNA polymerase subunit sigma-70 [Bacilli bacterium]
MFTKLLKYLFKDFYLFTAAYSNNVFPDPLPKEEEAIYIERALLGDKEARNKLIEHNLRLV